MRKPKPSNKSIAQREYIATLTDEQKRAKTQAARQARKKIDDPVYVNLGSVGFEKTYGDWLRAESNKADVVRAAMAHYFEYLNSKADTE